MCTPTPPRPRTIKAGERQDILFGGGHRQNPLSCPDDRPTAAVAWPPRSDHLRFSRIYPVYLVALVSMVPLALHAPWDARVFGVASPTAKTATFLAHAGLVQGWAPQLATSWNLPGWSVSAEAFFYLGFTLLVFQLSRVR